MSPREHGSTGTGLLLNPLQSIRISPALLVRASIQAATARSWGGLPRKLTMATLLRGLGS